MPYPFQLRPPDFSAILRRIQAAVYRPLGGLTVEAWVTDEPVPYAERRSGRHVALRPGDVWGKLFDCAWMRFSGTLPDGIAGQEIVLLIDFNGEGLAVDAAGQPKLGLTTVNTAYDPNLGSAGKTVVPLGSAFVGGESVELWVDAGNNDLFGVQPDGGRLVKAQIAVCGPEMKALAYDFEVLSGLAAVVDAKSARCKRVVAALYEASNLLRRYTDEEAAQARAILAPALARRGTPDSSLTLSAVGHAHMDLAWLWPIRETIRKCARSFATVLALMERYPEYVFGASQPQQYAWVKEHYPGLYERIRTRVAEGRWEPQGAMWVEPDTNIPSGESLVRQLLYGKRFFREEFGVEIDHLWEPDVFGYTAALPQILAKSGVRYFMTQKISWNEINKFPHQTFWWEGIDGSRVLSHMLPEETYNGPANPRAIHFAERNYFDSPVSDRALMLFGIGDGGGGPGEEHLERLRRETSLDGLCPVVQEPARRFFPRLDADAEKYAAWRGELYLEKHQGTLTTQARSKRYNRKIEYLLRELELSMVWARQAGGYTVPKADLDRIWREVLLYQFHDILPGSSITRVYDESLPRYAVILAELEGLLAHADAAWSRPAEQAGDPLLVNSLSWARTQWLEAAPGDWRKVALPPLSRMTLAAADTGESLRSDLLRASDNVLENDLLRVTLGESGLLASVYDKAAGREALDLSAGGGNRLSLYDDDGDAWDFAIDFQQKPPAALELAVPPELTMDGPRAVARLVYRMPGGLSALRQEVALTLGSRRIDFVTAVDWHESAKMLRTSFQVDVRSDTVVCDIQFGAIERPTIANTTWDAAKHEIAAHKWIDLTEPGSGYGVALLNDCKYGHRARGNALDLNLLRSPGGPDPQADRARHEFTYSLYPHPGTRIAAGVAQAGYELNIPIRILPDSTLPDFKEARHWLIVGAPSIVVETIKPAEEGSGAVVRCYESSGSRTRALLTFSFAVETIELVDLMEEHPAVLVHSGHNMELEFGPFEIHTLRITPA